MSPSHHLTPPQPAWMGSLVSGWLAGGESNCSWSVVYVTVISECY